MLNFKCVVLFTYLFISKSYISFSPSLPLHWIFIYILKYTVCSAELKHWLVFFFSFFLFFFFFSLKQTLYTVSDRSLNIMKIIKSRCFTQSLKALRRATTKRCTDRTLYTVILNLWRILNLLALHCNSYFWFHILKLLQLSQICYVISTQSSATSKFQLLWLKHRNPWSWSDNRVTTTKM